MLMRNKTFCIVKYSEIGRFSENNGRRQALGVLMRNKTFRMAKFTKIARFSENNGRRQALGMLTRDNLFKSEGDSQPGDPPF